MSFLFPLEVNDPSAGVTVPTKMERSKREREREACRAVGQIQRWWKRCAMMRRIVLEYFLLTVRNVQEYESLLGEALYARNHTLRSTMMSPDVGILRHHIHCLWVYQSYFPKVWDPISVEYTTSRHFMTCIIAVVALMNQQANAVIRSPGSDESRSECEFKENQAINRLVNLTYRVLFQRESACDCFVSLNQASKKYSYVNVILTFWLTFSRFQAQGQLLEHANQYFVAQQLFAQGLFSDIHRLAREKSDAEQMKVTVSISKLGWNVLFQIAINVVLHLQSSICTRSFMWHIYSIPYLKMDAMNTHLFYEHICKTSFSDFSPFEQPGRNSMNSHTFDSEIAAILANTIRTGKEYLKLQSLDKSSFAGLDSNGERTDNALRNWIQTITVLLGHFSCTESHTRRGKSFDYLRNEIKWLFAVPTINFLFNIPYSKLTDSSMLTCPYEQAQERCTRLLCNSHLVAYFTNDSSATGNREQPEIELNVNSRTYLHEVAVLYQSLIEKWSQKEVILAIGSRFHTSHALCHAILDVYETGVLKLFTQNPSTLSSSIRCSMNAIFFLLAKCFGHFFPLCKEDEYYVGSTLLHDFESITALFSILLMHSVALDGDGHEQSMLQAVNACRLVLVERHSERNLCAEDIFTQPEIRHFLSIQFSVQDLHHQETRDPVKRISIRIVRNFPFLLSFEERTALFKFQIESERLHRRTLCYEVVIRRTHLLNDSLREFQAITCNAPLGESRPLVNRIKVIFVDEFETEEIGIDGGGVFREFVHAVIREASREELGFFCTTKGSVQWYPNPIAPKLYTPEYCHDFYHFLGQLCGKAIIEGVPLDWDLTRFFICQIIGRPFYFSDMRVYDEKLYSGMSKLRDVSDVATLNITFSLMEDCLGTTREVELIPNGSNVMVTNENRLTYLHAVAQYKLHQQFSDLTTVFRKGFFEVCRPHWFHIFTCEEFAMLLSGGERDIDIDDLERNTKYVHEIRGSSHPTVRMLFTVLRKNCTPSDRRAFLKFCTAHVRPPALGFRGLDPPFTVQVIPGDETSLGDTAQEPQQLPTASTCFNLLKLPAYHSISTLCDKLLTAIHSHTGFHLS